MRALRELASIVSQLSAILSLVLSVVLQLSSIIAQLLQIARDFIRRCALPQILAQLAPIAL